MIQVLAGPAVGGADMKAETRQDHLAPLDVTSGAELLPSVLCSGMSATFAPPLTPWIVRRAGDKLTKRAMKRREGPARQLDQKTGQILTPLQE